MKLCRVNPTKHLKSSTCGVPTFSRSLSRKALGSSFNSVSLKTAHPCLRMHPKYYCSAWSTAPNSQKHSHLSEQEKNQLVVKKMYRPILRKCRKFELQLARGRGYLDYEQELSPFTKWIYSPKIKAFPSPSLTNLGLRNEMKLWTDKEIQVAQLNYHMSDRTPLLLCFARKIARHHFSQIPKNNRISNSKVDDTFKVLSNLNKKIKILSNYTYSPSSQSTTNDIKVSVRSSYLPQKSPDKTYCFSYFVVTSDFFP